MGLILLYSEGMQSNLNYLDLIKKRPDLFTLIVEMPSIPPKKKTGALNFSITIISFFVCLSLTRSPISGFIAIKHFKHFFN